MGVFALDDVPYRGRRLSILWDKDGTRYQHGAGLRVLADGKEIASLPTLGKISATLPTAAAAAVGTASAAGASGKTLLNYAVNNDGDYYPRFTASHTDPKTPLNKVNDGHAWYTVHPPNRWTTAGSTNATDWLAVDFGAARRVSEVRLYWLDDGTNVVAPKSYTLEQWEGDGWKKIPGQQRNPEVAAGHRANVVRLAALDTRKLRVVFAHAASGRTGLSEFEAWGEGSLPYEPAPPPPGIWR